LTIEGGQGEIWGALAFGNRALLPAHQAQENQK
jgi:hypothetical protein